MLNQPLKLLGAFFCLWILIKSSRAYWRDRQQLDARHQLWSGICAFIIGIIGTAAEGFVQRGMPPMQHVAYNAILNVLIFAISYNGLGFIVAITGQDRRRLRSVLMVLGVAYPLVVLVDVGYQFTGVDAFSKAYSGILAIALGSCTARIIYWYHKNAKSVSAVTRWRMRVLELGCILCLFYPLSLRVGTTWAARPNVVLLVTAWGLFALSMTIPQWFQRLVVFIEESREVLRQILLLVGLVSYFHNEKRNPDPRRMEMYLRKFADGSGMDEAQTEAMVRASYLSEVGRLPMPQGRMHLSTDHLKVDTPSSGTGAWAAVRAVSAVFASELLGWRDVGKILRHTKERWDGDGYPDGLKGEDIPIESRVLAIVETFSSSLEETGDKTQALARIRAEAGRELDPQRVEKFAVLIEEEMVG
jgi:hypothetical protein